MKHIDNILKNRLLAAASEDYLSLCEFISIVADEKKQETYAAQQAAVEYVCAMLADGSLHAGMLMQDGSFKLWKNFDPNKFRALLEKHGSRVFYPGEVCWFQASYAEKRQ